MWAYVDESGCMGMNISSGSSPIFAVMAILFRDKSQADECFQSIEGLKAPNGVKKEFKFSKCHHRQRMAFFTEIAKFDFWYFGIVFDKRKIIRFSKPFCIPPCTLHSRFMSSA